MYPNHYIGDSIDDSAFVAKTNIFGSPAILTFQFDRDNNSKIAFLYYVFKKNFTSIDSIKDYLIKQYPEYELHEDEESFALLKDNFTIVLHNFNGSIFVLAYTNMNLMPIAFASDEIINEKASQL